VKIPGFARLSSPTLRRKGTSVPIFRERQSCRCGFKNQHTQILLTDAARLGGLFVSEGCSAKTSPIFGKTSPHRLAKKSTDFKGAKF
jgi:hypothetical protein